MDESFTLEIELVYTCTVYRVDYFKHKQLHDEINTCKHKLIHVQIILI